MKKITKFLPLAMALLLVSPAMATPATSENSIMQITVPEFINIKKVSETNTATATFDGDYTQITIDQLSASFQVINNLPERAIYLKGTAPVVGDDNAKALYGTKDALKLVFTNDSRRPENTSISDIMAGSSGPAGNPNAIAFAITASDKFAPDTSSGAQDPIITFEDNVVKYVISNGVYNPVYTIATSAESNTFSTHDAQGTYKATLTLTTTNP